MTYWLPTKYHMHLLAVALNGICSLSFSELLRVPELGKDVEEGQSQGLVSMVCELSVHWTRLSKAVAKIHPWQCSPVWLSVCGRNFVTPAFHLLLLMNAQRGALYLVPRPDYWRGDKRQRSCWSTETAPSSWASFGTIDHAWDANMIFKKNLFVIPILIISWQENQASTGQHVHRLLN